MSFRHTLRPLLAAVALLITGVFALPGHAASPYPGFVNEHAYVPTPYGAIYVQYWRPVSGKVPVIFSMSPYHYVYTRTTADAAITDTYSDRFVPQGYGRAYADLLGTGLSDGCWNYGGAAEAAAGAAVVEWLGTRPWSTGKVGMIGTSYDGAIQTEIATLAPRHLAAIVPQEPVTSWYHYNYDQAVLYNSSDEEKGNESQTGYLVGTPDLFDFGLSRTPNTDPNRSPQEHLANLSDRTSECDAIEHNFRGHWANPTYDAFWQERDWSLRAGNVRAAVLMQHGWDDNNTKPQQFARYWAGLTHAADRRAVLGQWVHTDVFDTPPSGVRFPVVLRDYLTAFFDRYLKGAPASVLSGFPKVLSESEDGAFRTTWSVRRLTTVSLPAGSFVNTGTESSAVFQRSGVLSLPSLYTAALPIAARDQRWEGSGSVTVTAVVQSLRGQLDATVLDVAPDGTSRVVTMGMLDLRYRSSLGAPTAVIPGEPFTTTIALRPQDWPVKAGHHLTLVLAGSEAVWGVPDPVIGQQTTLSSVHLSLPIAALEPAYTG